MTTEKQWWDNPVHVSDEFADKVGGAFGVVRLDGESTSGYWYRIRAKVHELDNERWWLRLCCEGDE